jgi:carbamoyltransferase
LRLEEEKLAQVKGFYGYPKKSIRQILNTVDPHKKTKVVIGHKSIFEVFNCHRILIKFCGLASRFEYFFYLFDLAKFIFPRSKFLRKSIKYHLEFNLRRKSELFSCIQYCDHHEAHAYSAIYDSGYSECTVITLDGKGDFFSGKTFDYSEGKLRLINAKRETSSYGLVYSAATKALGFKMLRHEGKITGLAAYGEPFQISKIISERYLQLNSDPLTERTKLRALSFREKIASRFFDVELKPYSNLVESWVHFFSNLLDEGVSKEDIAAGVQNFLEGKVLDDVLHLQQSGQIRSRVALAGGVFANVKLNQRIWETGYFSSMFVQPAMDDAGTALGAAASVLDEQNSTGKLEQIVYLGRQQDIGEIEMDLRQAHVTEIPTVNLGLECARLISEGSILGIYNGRTEWGPRALGNRSIIASAYLAQVPNFLNLRLGRNDFMPFAPIIRDVDAGKVFENYSDELLASKFMTVTLNVKSEIRELIPSVVHLDGTARPQVLHKEDNPGVYEILNGIAEQHGIGIALNTSFNMHELPILDSLKVAIHNLSIGAIDYLVVNNKQLLKLERD